MKFLLVFLASLAFFMFSAYADEHLRGVVADEVPANLWDVKSMVKPMKDNFKAQLQTALESNVKASRPSLDTTVKNAKNDITYYNSGYSIQRQTDNMQCKMNNKASVTGVYNLNNCHPITTMEGVGSMSLSRTEYPNDSWEITSWYYSDDKCTQPLVASLTEAGKGCENYARETWNEKRPKLSGVIANLGFDSNCPKKFNVDEAYMSRNVFPMNTCVSTDDGQSRIITNCKEADGKIVVSGKSYKTNDCTGKSKSVRNIPAFDVCESPEEGDSVFVRYTCK